MAPDPTFPTTHPYGLFKLYQNGPAADVHIKGSMRQMPPPASAHGFHINYGTYPGYGADCHYSTAPRWDAQGSQYITGNAGAMNGFPS